MIVGVLGGFYAPCSDGFVCARFVIGRAREGPPFSFVIDEFAAHMAPPARWVRRGAGVADRAWNACAAARAASGECMSLRKLGVRFAAPS
jgi:hypothetical protein